MRITFLGTSSGTPTRRRNVTSQALSFDDGAVWLLDCGEATQHQLMKSGIRPKAVERILITHLHGDHCYGLPGLLACLAVHDRRDPVQVVGPRGLRRMVEAVLDASELSPAYPLDLVEVDVRAAGPGSGGNGVAISAVEGGVCAWTATAHAIVHRAPCVGYLLREPPRPGRFHPDKARAAGVPESALWGRLQRGQAVEVDGRRIESSAVCDPPRRGRVIVLLGDTSDADALIAPGRGCDLAVRETTYDQSRDAKAKAWGHSTTTMTGTWAAALQPKLLIITHFSARYTDESSSAAHADGDLPSEALTTDDLVRETAAACPGIRVLAADDLWSCTIPPAE